MKIVIIDYDAGNVGSVANALKRLGVNEFEITSNIEVIKVADGVIFPGQGRAGPAMRSLEESGLDKLIPTLKQPFLGICLGLQFLMESSDEDNTTALGIVKGSCTKLKTDLPVPHMGWNELQIEQATDLFKGVAAGEHVYFANSYVVNPAGDETTATTVYGDRFSCAIKKENFYGIQFHPEKSGPTGERILRNFIGLCGGRT
jgi:glutamine amidotransferase